MPLPKSSPRWFAPALLAAFCLGCGGDPAPSASSAFPNRRRVFATNGFVVGYVSNSRSDSISVVDLDRMIELGAAPIGRNPVDLDGPHHVVVDGRRGLAYVALSYPPVTDTEPGTSLRAGYVQALALSDFRPLSELRVDPNPLDLALSDATGQLAVTHYDLERSTRPSGEIEARRAKVTLIDAAAVLADAAPRTVTACVAPSSVAYDGTGSRAYVACTGEDSLVVIDTKLARVVTRVPVGEAGTSNKPFALVVDPSGNHLLIGNKVARSVARFDMSDAPVRRFTSRLRGVPYFAVWIPGPRWLVPTQSPDGAALVHADTGDVLSEVEYPPGACDKPREARSSPDGRVFVLCEGDRFDRGRVVTIDPETLGIESGVEVGVYPDRLVVMDS